MTTDDVGSCSGKGGKCANATPSSSFAFCESCAVYEGACPGCGFPHQAVETPDLYVTDVVTTTEAAYCDGACMNRVFTTVMTQASVCGHDVTSGGQSYCTRCAVVNGICAVCGKSPAPEKPETD